MKRISTTLLLIIYIALGATAQTQVTPYRPGLTPEGITYFLPQTRLQLTLTATRRHYEPGEYARYTERFLREHDAPTAAYDEWTLTAASLTPYAVADVQQAYTVKLKSNTLAPLLTLTDDGRLVAINAELSPDTYAAPTLAKPGVRRTVEADLSGQKAKTPEMLAATSTAKMAELAATEIYDIRENRDLLMKGQADFMPKDGEQLRLMLERLDKQERALLSLFHGTMYEEEHTFTLDITPARAEKDLLFARFSRHLGLVGADNLAGEPLFLTIHPLGAPAPASEAELYAVNKGKTPKEVLDVRYLVPQAADVLITATPEAAAPFAQNVNQALVLCSVRTPIAQFGTVEHLGGDLFNKKQPIVVELDPLSGGIRHIRPKNEE